LLQAELSELEGDIDGAIRNSPRLDRLMPISWPAYPVSAKQRCAP
jgi:hypothetical protein